MLSKHWLRCLWVVGRTIWIDGFCLDDFAVRKIESVVTIINASLDELIISCNADIRPTYHCVCWKPGIYVICKKESQDEEKVTYAN